MVSVCLVDFYCEQFIWGKLIKAGKDVKGYTIVGKSSGLSEEICGRVLSLAKIGVPTNINHFNGVFGLFEIPDDLVVIASYQRSPEPEPNRTYFLQTRYLVMTHDEYERIGANFAYLIPLIDKIRFYEEPLELLPFRGSIQVSLDREAEVVKRVLDTIPREFVLKVLRAAIGPDYPLALYDFPSYDRQDLEFLETLVLLLPIKLRSHITFATMVPEPSQSPVWIKLNPSGELRERHIVARMKDHAVVPTSFLDQIVERYVRWIDRELAQDVNLLDLIKTISVLPIENEVERHSIHTYLSDMIVPYEAPVLKKEYEVGQASPTDIYQFLLEAGHVLAEDFLIYFGGKILEACLENGYDPAIADNVFARLTRLDDGLFVDRIPKYLDYKSKPSKIVRLLCEHAPRIGADNERGTHRLLPLLSPALRRLGANPELASYLLEKLLEWNLQPNLFRRCLENDTVKMVLEQGAPMTTSTLLFMLGMNGAPPCSIGYLHNELQRPDLYISVFRYVLDNKALHVLDSNAFVVLNDILQNQEQQIRVPDSRIVSLIDGLIANFQSNVNSFSDSLEPIGRLAIIADSKELLSLCVKAARYKYNQGEPVAEVVVQYIAIAREYRNPRQVARLISAAIENAAIEAIYNIHICNESLEHLSWNDKTCPLVDLLAKQFVASDPASQQRHIAEKVVLFYERTHTPKAEERIASLCRRFLHIACVQESTQITLDWLDLWRRCAAITGTPQDYRDDLEALLKSYWNPKSPDHIKELMENLPDLEKPFFNRVIRYSILELCQVFIEYAFERIRKLEVAARSVCEQAASQSDNGGFAYPSHDPDERKQIFAYLRERLALPRLIRLLFPEAHLLECVNQLKEPAKWQTGARLSNSIRAISSLDAEMRFLDYVLSDLLDALNKALLRGHPLPPKPTDAIKSLMEMAKPRIGTTSFYEDLKKLHHAIDRP